jgi:hypothetical protein
MPAIPRISLVRLEKSTSFAPLAVLGAYVRAHDLLSPIFTRVQFSKQMHTEDPLGALVDLWVSILAGCRSVHQVNTKIRPDLALAQAWGRERFCEQSTLARVLDACEAEHVQQLREGVEAVYRWIGRAPRGGWEVSPLMIDIDLTGLPAGRQAQGSTKGYFSKKKGCADGNCAGLARPTMKRASLRYCILAIN